MSGRDYIAFQYWGSTMYSVEQTTAGLVFSYEGCIVGYPPSAKRADPGQSRLPRIRNDSLIRARGEGGGSGG